MRRIILAATHGTEASRYVFGSAILTHRVATHLNTVSVVNQPVEDAISERGIADLFVPARDRKLRGKDRGAHLVTIIADLPEVAALW
jgi:hypothetical protein